MEIRRVLQSLGSLVGRGAAPAKPVEPIQALQPGQRLEARVLSRIGEGQLLLELDGRRLVADSTVPLRPGTRVRLEVVKPGFQPQLRVLESIQQPQITGLKTLLPRQIPLAEAMRALAELAGDTSTDEALPSSIREPISRLLRSLPTLKDLTSADVLARTLDRSGLFSEAAPSQNAFPDLKQRLLQIAAVLRQETKETSTKTTAAEPSPPIKSAEVKPVVVAAPSRISGTSTPGGQAPPLPDGTSETRRPNATETGERLEQLLHKVSGAVARIVLDQLNSVPKPENPALTWHFELPFRQGQEFHDLRIVIRGERSSAPRKGGTRPWTVDLEMDLPDLGRIQARLIYANGEVSTHLWSDRTATRTLFERHLERLAQRLRQAGLALGNLRVTEAAVTKPQAAHDTPLIDERA